MSVKSWIVIPSLLMAMPAVTQGQELRGLALEQGTGRPIADALVALMGRRGEQLDSSRTAADGSFAVRSTAGGKFFLQVRRSGHPVEETDAIFLEDGEVRVDTLYVLAPVKMETARETLEREVTRLFGFPLSSIPARALLLPERIDSVRATARYASEILLQRGPANLRVEGAGTGRVCYQIHSASSCALIYINGQPAPPWMDFPATDLEAAIVVTSHHAQTVLGANPGVVMLYTRGMLRSRPR